MNYTEFKVLSKDSFISMDEFSAAMIDMINTTPIVHECVDRHGNGCNKLFKILEDKMYSKGN